MVIAESVAGALLLIFGRDTDWMFVSAIGLLTGLRYSPYLFPNAPGWVHLVIAIVLAAICFAVLTRSQGAAMALGGFLTGGYLLSLLIMYPRNPWLPFVAGGLLVGGLVFTSLKNITLIITTSLIGALILVNLFRVPPNGRIILLAGLFIAGGLIQALLLNIENKAGGPS
ncbi:MAG: hypothetical protein JXA13_15975 [Anaerolineales bacterium]|nr:hypothetical protein [Anaerolineales bacterium]